MLIKQFKSGGVVTINNAPHIIENVEKHTPSARGAATIYKIRCRNLLTQNKTDITGHGEDNYDEPDFQTRPVQFLYIEGTDYVFMDNDTYDQYPLDEHIVGNAKYYLSEDLEGLYALLLEEHIVGIRLPDVAEMKLEECDPAIKGQSVTNRGKSAKTETGLVVQVPEYMEQGDVVRVNTGDGKFLGRVGTKF
ncbi:MAG: translation elongation factor EF-P [Lentisphaeria bacterium]